jgi:hypothetical protein
MRAQRLTREEGQAQTRERLLDAARRMFARGGYGGASVDTIAAEAGSRREPSIPTSGRRRRSSSHCSPATCPTKQNS